MGSYRKDVFTQNDLFQDLAGRHKSNAGVNPNIVDPNTIATDLDAILAHGFLIIENLIEKDVADSYLELLNELFEKTGRNNFEGYKTQRIYSLLGKTRRFDTLIDHARILALLDHLLMPNYLVSMAQAIKINPGESPQPLHHDDAFYPIPRPRDPLSVATIWPWMNLLKPMVPPSRCPTAIDGMIVNLNYPKPNPL